MVLNPDRARRLLAKVDLRSLFIEELGWDQHSATLEVVVGGSRLALQALAQKRGMVAYQLDTPLGQRLPDYARRRKIEHQVAKLTHEHLIVFTDVANQVQIWQWVKREPGKPAACREHTFHQSQPGDALLQKLEAIAFSLEEEEQVSLVDVARRTRAGFDVERVTKRFYERFQAEHAAFLEFITGITKSADREWYASVMLNRLMFVYFIQRKGFLDGDRSYLRNRLSRMRAQHGKDKFYSFYRYFLLRLFHEGLGGSERTPDLEQLVGRIPYLNGGLFDIHELEKSDSYGETIQIPDEAFERIFDYFDQYQWHLDERPLRADNEINPDVLGYIFEKYINQKQMGAYYTKEDITEYVGKTTVLPFLFDHVRVKCNVPFETTDGPTVWDLLREDPERYIYPAVRHGTDEPLPDDIAVGLNPPTLHRPVGEAASVNDIETVRLRREWNKPAPASHALPTETWRELIARRSRHEALRTKLLAGGVRDINEMIALNLDIRQFAQDTIENCEDPELLRAFWHAIEQVTILDPTCGSGAFLFAALNILEPLYEACIDRMEAFVEDVTRSSEKRAADGFNDFRDVLANVAAHANRRYFILKSIILNNLFGVDIMEEAVEICKLRLFLKLAAQVEPDTAKANLGIEPLPDVDFNIRAGNTLVGFARYDEVLTHAEGDLIRQQEIGRIKTSAEDLQRAFDAFRARQVEGSRTAPAKEKRDIRTQLKRLDHELNRYLAGEHGFDPGKKEAFDEWLVSHQPFHWFVEFHDITRRGGFDVIIGNPPYVELSDLKGQYQVRGLSLLSTGNLYALCLERFAQLLQSGGRMGVIVPISAVSTPRMLPLMTFLSRRFNLFASNYAVRPAKLFVGVDMNLTIFVARKRANGDNPQLFSTRYLRWNEEARPHLFKLLSYAPSRLMQDLSSLPKLGSAEEGALLNEIEGHPKLTSIETKRGGDVVYYHSGGRYFRKAIRRQLSNEYKPLRLRDGWGDVVVCLMSSSFYYWLWIQLSDCYHVTRRDVELIPVPPSLLEAHDFKKLATRLLADLEHHASRRIRRRADGSQQEEVNYHVGRSMNIINEIDRALSTHYDLSEADLDLIMSYDMKFRSADAENND